MSSDKNDDPSYYSIIYYGHLSLCIFRTGRKELLLYNICVIWRFVQNSGGNTYLGPYMLELADKNNFIIDSAKLATSYCRCLCDDPTSTQKKSMTLCN